MNLVNLFQNFDYVFLEQISKFVDLCLSLKVFSIVVLHILQDMDSYFICAFIFWRYHMYMWFFIN